MISTWVQPRFLVESLLLIALVSCFVVMCLCFVCLRLVFTMFLLSLFYLFLIASSGFSNVYLLLYFRSVKCHNCLIHIFMEDDLDILSENMALIDLSKLFKYRFAHIASILHIILYKLLYLDKCIIV